VKGKFVTVYIPEQLVNEWVKIENKSKFVQEAIANAGQGNTSTAS